MSEPRLLSCLKSWKRFSTLLTRRPVVAILTSLDGQRPLSLRALLLLASTFAESYRAVAASAPSPPFCFWRPCSTHPPSL